MPEGIRFKPGVSGNPAGRPRHSQEWKDFKSENKFKIEDSLHKFLRWPVEDLIEYARKTDIPVMDMMVVRILIETIKKGDNVRLEWLLTRIIGKVKEETSVELTFKTLHEQIVDEIQKLEKPAVTED